MEKTKGRLAFLMVCLLFLSPFLVFSRISIADRKITTRDVVARLALGEGVIKDREGNVIKDGDEGIDAPHYMGNLIGFKTPYGDHVIGNSIEGKLSHLLYDDIKVNSLRGYRTIDETAVRAMVTTLLPLSSQKEIYRSFRGYNGTIFAYNYKNGEVYVAMSLPSVNSYSPDEEEEAGLSKLNIAVNGVTDGHGSTMKIPSVILAGEQGIDLESFRYSCSGKLPLSNREKIDCPYAHGNNLTVTDIIGLSCNCGIATLASNFRKEETKQILLNMGFELKNFSTGENTKIRPQLKEAFANRTLSRYFSEIYVSDFVSHRGLWTFIGAADCMISPVHISMLSGAVASGGEAAEPVYVRQITTEDGQTVLDDFTLEDPVLTTLFSRQTAETVRKMWSDATEEHYRERLPEAVTMAKTGTAQNEGTIADKSLLCVLEDYDTALFISVNTAGGGSNIAFDICDTFCYEMEKTFGAPVHREP